MKGKARTALSQVLIVASTLLTLAGPARADPAWAGVEAYARGEYPRAANRLLPLAERGDARAQTYVGIMYLRGEGVPHNFDEAARWLREAARAGVSEAQYFLGLMYDKGQGVAQDFVLAEAWLNLAAARSGPGSRWRFVRIRDAVASKMSRDQLDEARRLALDWREGQTR